MLNQKLFTLLSHEFYEKLGRRLTIEELDFIHWISENYSNDCFINERETNHEQTT
ncbi:hypothetical protein QA612_14710 [Evansella sp. AB-P1]|uniref:hypothetical protein n=1 Tax=Evansella sp. AB-P1 TaxID=3037653 RepID=UPI00241E34D1|nr:hypothetical protein [Evansella sp. AB-P1]MDG5788726.1 hypothetical protein [Evansella sp. AB-P1]